MEKTWTNAQRVLEPRRNQSDEKHQSRNEDSDYWNGVEEKDVPFGVRLGPPNELLHFRFTVGGKHIDI